MDTLSPAVPIAGTVSRMPACQLYRSDLEHRKRLTRIRISVRTMIAPLYQAELAHRSIRQVLTSLQQIILGIGGVCGS
jgi:hypothetical protein